MPWFPSVEAAEAVGLQDPQLQGEKDHGEELRLEPRVSGLERGDSQVEVSIDLGGETKQLTVDRVILAVGITGNVEDLGLEGTGVAVERGHIVVNEWL